MKKTIIGLLLSLLTAGTRAEDVITSAQSPYVSRGVSITTNSDASSLTYTNVSPEPWFPVSIYIDQYAGTTNTVSFEVVRVHDIRIQFRQSDVTTNFFGRVETNQYDQVTNVVANVSTVQLFNAVTTGATLSAISIPFQIKADDALRLRQSDTNENTFIISGRR